MSTRVVNKEIETRRERNSQINNYIVRILIVLFFLALIIGMLVFCINSSSATKTHSIDEKSVGQLIWEAVFSVPSGIILIFEILASFLLLKYNIELKRLRMLIYSLIIFIVSVFNHVAINVSLEASWIVLGNLIPMTIISIIPLLSKNEIEDLHTGKKNKGNMLNRALTTSHKSIIAVQLYRVKTTQIIDEKKNDLVRFCVSHFGDDFVRAGHDLNSISQITYELDRTVVDTFQIILNMYHNFRKSGDEVWRDAAKLLIDGNIEALQLKLKSIEKENREITKYDCCIARALTILLSFKKILVPDSMEGAVPDNYLGEISLKGGDLNLNTDTEDKLFTLYRTGILGAILLDDKSCHVFDYRKKGTKSGRRYLALQIYSVDKQTTNEFTSQTMYICLVTLNNIGEGGIPYHVFDSIKEREKQIKNALNKMKNRGDIHVEG